MREQEALLAWRRLEAAEAEVVDSEGNWRVLKYDRSVGRGVEESRY